MSGKRLDLVGIIVQDMAAALAEPGSLVEVAGPLTSLLEYVGRGGESLLFRSTFVSFRRWAYMLSGESRLMG